MSNTSLKKIQIPALNHANFGKAIMEQFANIDANFQKLSNFELNAGVPGKSCLYATINLAAPFVYPTSDVNNPQKNTTDWNAWVMWSGYDRVFTAELQDTWTQLKDSVAADYEQFRRLTGLREYEYAAIAAKMLWGYSITFTGSDSAKPTAESLTGALRAKYGSVEGPVECEDANGNKTTYYGNWLAEIFMMNEPDETVIRERAEFFKKHVRITVPGRIIVALSPSDKEIAYYPVGSLEYWYIDPRFRNAAVDRADTMVQDMSCVMHWTPEGTTDDISWPGHFEILEIFPTIRRGADGKYYWFINGMNTGVPVQGPAGRDGASAKLVIVQRVENVLGYHPQDYPNGKIAVGPRIGDWKVPMSAFAGDSPRNLPSRTQMVNDMPTIVPQWVKKGDWPGWPENLIPVEQNEYGRTTSFQLKVDKGTAWLGNYEDGYVLNEPENLFRIYRIVGREIFWMGPDKSDIPDEKDPVNHRCDPSCDEYYFKRNHASEPSDSTTIQQLIEQLDGATAIVLPGPAYQYDRTDSTYWITTLRKVEWHRPNDDENARSGRYMLMAYCSDEERIHNSLDEHTQAGMMQRLDAYAYKSNGDNRNKPRGLMLPIGSAYAAYADGEFEWAWASHIMHSDCGGFTGFRNGRGVQHVNTINKKETVTSDTMHDVTGRAMSAAEAQYTEIIGKRILHIGSVNDYRALNYVENHTDKGWNGGVPGRIEPSQNLPGKIGNADFYGQMVYGRWINGRRAQWFEGSELHVDEPLTITRYRDLHKRQRLLNVEGDVVIGPRTHKNGPGLTYRNRDGGLVVHSTISPDTAEDQSIFPASYTPSNTIFSREWYGGLVLNHRAFYNTLADAGEQSWKTQFGRWKYGDGNYRAFYDVDGNAISTAGPIARRSDRHMFSILGDDGIGARVMVAQDGFAVYNPNWANENGKKLTSFSVDAMGNIQTMGQEVRSNADNTLWILHSRWTGEPHSYADMQYVDDETGPDIDVDWSWLNTGEGDLKNMIFTFPGHNQLMFGTDHEAHFVYEKNRSIERLERSWRATNFYPWKGTENTTLCRVPMGWVINFGPIDDTGYHMRTFMEKRNGSFGQSWGSNELMPVTTVWSSDINHFHGTLHVNGADCMAIRSKAKENERLQNQYLSGRYGSQIAHGLIVGPALRTINNDNGTPRILDVQDFLNDSLYMQYRSIPWWENDVVNSDEWGQGDDASPMFTGITKTPIAIWGRGSIFAQNSLIADEDLVVNRAATIRAQARAKSFRRHYNSFDKDSKWAFLLDNGYSSVEAYAHSTAESYRPIPATPEDNSPIYIDYGEFFGPDRLMKFGYSRNIRANANGTKISYKNGTYNEDDRNLCLVAKSPFTNISKSKTGFLFNNRNGGLPFEARFVCISGVCMMHITIDVNMVYTSRDSNKEGPFGRHRRSLSFGIDNNGSAPNADKNDVGSAPGVSEGGEKGKWQNALNRLLRNTYRTMVCTGLNGFFNDITELLPKQDLHFFVGSLYKGREDCNWNVGGKDSDRSFQKGLWFRLKTDGTIDIPYANDPGSLMAVRQKITVSFTWPAGNIGEQIYSIFATSTNASGAGAGIIRQSDIVTGFGQLDAKQYTPTKQCEYVLVKNITSFKKPSQADFANVGWEVYLRYTETSVEYYTSNTEDEAPTKLPNDSLKINDSDHIALCDEFRKGERDIIPAKVFGGRRYIYTKMITYTAGLDREFEYMLLADAEENSDNVNVSNMGTSWMWDSQSSPNNVSLKTWIDGKTRASLKSAILGAMGVSEDSETESLSIGGRVTIQDAFGSGTIEKQSTNQFRVALWVTSWGEQGEVNLSHRSIVFTATLAGSDFNISGLSTYLLKDVFNPGYYKSTGRDGNKPAGTIEFIGTDQGNTVSTTNWPYIWRTNDGQSWTLIDSPFENDSSYVYLFSTSASTYWENKGAANQRETIFPAGFVCAFNASGNEVFKVGKDYFIPITGNETSLGKDNPTFKRVINNLKTSAVAPGKCKKVHGFTRCWKIRKTDWDNETARLTYQNYISISGSVSIESLTTISETNYSIAIDARKRYTAYFVNSKGSYLSNPINAEWNFANLRDGKIKEMQVWFGAAFNHMIIRNQWSSIGYNHKRELYSDAIGWPAGFDTCYMHGVKFAIYNIATEVSALAPSANIGAGSKCGYTGQFSVHYQTDEYAADGRILAEINQLEWSDEPGVPAGTKYLCYGFGLGPGDLYWPTGLPDDIAFKMSIPIVKFKSASLIINQTRTGKRFLFNYDGTNHTFTEL